jgi:tungstate transport system substrate-binding protein
MVLCAAALLAGCGTDERADSGDLLLASTTSTEDSGLLDVLLPAFEDATGYDVRLISGGSGQAIENGRRGDVDVLLVHSPEAELQMVEDGDGIERAPVMHNDFVILGPTEFEAGFPADSDVAGVMRAIAERGAAFVSRGDNSGTHVAELRLWERAVVDPETLGDYIETGQGQAATIRVADELRGYALTDRGTFLALEEDIGITIAWDDRVEPLLQNPYHVIVVNPDKHDVNAEGARAFAAWVTGEEGQRLIAEFGVEEYGEPLFVPDGLR